MNKKIFSLVLLCAVFSVIGSDSEGESEGRSLHVSQQTSDVSGDGIASAFATLSAVGASRSTESESKAQSHVLGFSPAAALGGVLEVLNSSVVTLSGSLFGTSPSAEKLALNALGHMMRTAVLTKKKDQLGLLLKKDGAVEAAQQNNDDGDNAFHLACSVGDIDIIKAFNVPGMNVDCLNGKKRTALQRWLKLMHEDIVNTLVDMGAEIGDRETAIVSRLTRKYAKTETFSTVERLAGILAEGQKKRAMQTMLTLEGTGCVYSGASSDDE